MSAAATVAYSMSLARRYPLLQATVYELPRVVPVARRLIEEAGMSDRVTVQEGDFQQEGLGEGYDMALVFGVMNGEPPEGRPALIRKVFEALNPGGKIVLRDFVLDPDRAVPTRSRYLCLADAAGNRSWRPGYPCRLGSMALRCRIFAPGNPRPTRLGWLQPDSCTKTGKLMIQSC